MSTVYDLRASIAAALVTAGIWQEDEIIIKRQTDIWNDIALAVGTSKNGMALAIGVAEGVSANKDASAGIWNDLTIPITTFCSVSLEEGATPEEDIWERTVGFLNGWVGRDALGKPNHSQYRLIYQRFSDDVELADQVASFLARQTIFTAKHHIPKYTPPTP